MFSAIIQTGRSALGKLALGAVVITAVTLTGCGTSRPADVPRSAVLKAEGDEGVAYVAETEGTVWVTNTSENRIAYSSPVRRGDQISADPRSGKLRLNGRLVADRAIRSGNHRIFFQSGVAGAPPVVISQSDEIRRPSQVPVAAQLRGEGTGRIEYTAPVDGAVWITDAENGSLVYSGRLNRGDGIVVDPRSPRDAQLTVSGRPVISTPLPNHNRRIYFQPGVEPFPDAVPAGNIAPADRVVLVERPQGVPNAAAVRYDGVGPADFVADRDGTVWVVNASTGRVVYSALINRGDIVVVDPARNRLLLNTHPVAGGEVPSGDRYRVFFAPQ